MINKGRIIVLIIWLLALGLRLYGVNWDQGQHLHPDERFLTMVATDVSLPHSIGDYFDSHKSPLNPYNYQQYQFFVYGTLPLFLTKLVAVMLDMDNYEQLVLVGRSLSALVDSLNIWWIFAIGGGWLGPLIYAVAVLPLQLSHFWAVDTFLTLFLGLALWAGWRWSQSRRPIWMIVGGVFWGLALACKITAVYFLPIIGLVWLMGLRKYWRETILGGLAFGVLGLMVFRIFQPYIFVDGWRIEPKFINNLAELSRLSTPSVWFPPSIQWIGKIRWLYPLYNIAFWGVGVGGSGLFILGLKKKLRQKWLVAGWIGLLFLIQGSMPAHTMRYFLPIYPAVAIIAGQAGLRWGKYLLVAHVLWGLAFLGIYRQEHGRVRASRWMYDNIEEGAIISAEYWDDALPLTIGERRFGTEYLEVFAPDTIQKWQKIDKQLERIDYVAMSSNRAWGTVGRMPELFPMTTEYYANWFADKESLVYQKQVYPNISLPTTGKCIYLGPTNYPGEGMKNWIEIKTCDRVGLYVRDDTAEEAFTVYDHPQVFVWENLR